MGFKTLPSRRQQCLDNNSYEVDVSKQASVEQCALDGSNIDLLDMLVPTKNLQSSLEE